MIRTYTSHDVVQDQLVGLPSAADIDRFLSTGWWLSPVPLFSDAQLAVIREGAKELLSDKHSKNLPSTFSGELKSGYRRFFDNALQRNEKLSCVLDSPTIGAAVSRFMLGASVRLFFNSLIYKEPLAVGDPRTESQHVLWHRDSDYGGPTCTSHDLVTAWLPLAACGPEDGALAFLTGSHRWTDEEVRSFTVRRRGFWSSSHDDVVIGQGAVRCGSFEVARPRFAPGQVSFHHFNTVHGSGPNLGSCARVGLNLTFQPGCNEYRRALRPDGQPYEYQNERLLEKTPDGRPNYADPVFCPTVFVKHGR